MLTRGAWDEQDTGITHKDSTDCQEEGCLSGQRSLTFLWFPQRPKNLVSEGVVVFLLPEYPQLDLFCLHGNLESHI